MYIESSHHLSRQREIKAESLGSLLAQLSIADIAVMLEAKQEEIIVFVGMRGDVCMTTGVESITVNGDCVQLNLETATYDDVLQSPEFSEVTKEIKSAEIVKLVPKDRQDSTPDDTG
mgnify:FL=1|jgi:putative heme degradation protein|tara:strand:+ start:19612 stop:19962 length:351 start_codon:yes stop_codon:yes gene_type:complete